MPNEPVDFAKLDPVLQAYLFDMRETLKKTRGEVTATAAERDAHLMKSCLIQYGKRGES